MIRVLSQDDGWEYIVYREGEAQNFIKIVRFIDYDYYSKTKRLKSRYRIDDEGKTVKTLIDSFSEARSFAKKYLLKKVIN